MLSLREKQKGEPLTEEEVLSIRDKAVCIVLSYENARNLEKGRGFIDIDPENCWEEWLKLR